MKVSIITVSFNSVKTIEETILSVINQSYSNIEYIIIDADSYDGTKKIIKKYKNKISKIIFEKDDGIYDAMNKGIGYATGEVIGILNSDDIYINEQIIEKVVSVMNQNELADGVYSDLNYISRSGKILRKWISGPVELNSFKNGWIIPHPTLFLKKYIYDKCGNYNLSYGNASDHEFILRIICQYKAKLIYSNFISVNMKIGGASNKNLYNIILQNIDVINSLKKYDINFSYIGFIFGKIKNRLKQYYIT